MGFLLGPPSLRTPCPPFKSISLSIHISLCQLQSHEAIGWSLCHQTPLCFVQAVPSPPEHLSPWHLLASPSFLKGSRRNGPSSGTSGTPSAFFTFSVNASALSSDCGPPKAGLGAQPLPGSARPQGLARCPWRTEHRKKGQLSHRMNWRPRNSLAEEVRFKLRQGKAGNSIPGRGNSRCRDLGGGWGVGRGWPQLTGLDQESPIGGA